jgi:DNA-3-methyladenine glycosylase
MIRRMRPDRPLPRSFYRRPADVVARDLLGRRLTRQLDGARLTLRIVETEAYLGVPDRASHAWAGRRTARTATLFRRGGVAYVYLVYGMHHMLNVVAGEAEDGSAVLLRAGEPLTGGEQMRRLRGLHRTVRPGDLAGGPGKLCRALAIDLRWDGRELEGGDLHIAAGEPVTDEMVAVGPRVGIDYAGEAAGWPLRFAVAGNAHVSRPWPTAAHSR